ncbi:MAG: efflux RND transporter periplasmic adaptor subunit [Pirellulales bacterium]|nr:efflux RND transporter periplasmic adaptor subunit [Pirellulales bacterium]
MASFPRQQVAAVLLCLGAGSSLAGCRGRNEFVPPPPPKVTVSQPVIRDVTEWVEFTGTTRAQQTVELRARVRGYLEKIEFEDGTQVKQGELLFVVEQAPFRAELEVARANLAKSDAAVQLANANLARSNELARADAVTREQLDLDRAELARTEAERRAAAAALTEAELNLQYTEIRAPLSGRIGRHMVDVGNLVLQDQTVLAVIENIDPIHAYFSVSELELLRFMQLRRENRLPDPEKQPPELELALADEDDYPHRGVLDFRQLGIDPATGTTLRRGVFPNPDLRMTPGMFVRIRAAVGAPQPRLLVEDRAIGTDQRGDYVLVVEGRNVVQQRPVRLGPLQQGLRVVSEGVKEGEWVVVNGLQRARPGTTVDPVREGSKSQAASTASAQAAVHAPEAVQATHR